MAKARPANAAQRARWEIIRALGCIVRGPHYGRTHIHHAGTGGGGRKNHDKVLPLCDHHHVGEEGIDSRRPGMSKRQWQDKYGTENELMALVELKLSGQEES